MALVGTSKFKGRATVGRTSDDIIELVTMINDIASKGKLRPGFPSLPSLYNRLRTSAGINDLTFESCTPAQYRVAFMKDEKDADIIQSGLDNFRIYEEIIVNIQTLVSGMSPLDH